VKKLTQKFIDAQSFNGTAKHIIWDGEVKGFGVRIYPTGKKSFVLDYRDNNRKNLMVIGSCSVLKVDAARKDAKEYLANLTKGINPLQERQKAKQGKLIKDLCKAYIESHAVKKKSGKDDITRIERFIIPAWGNLLATNIKRADVSALHIKLGKQGHYQANRVYSLLSKMFNLARAWGFVPEEHINPCFGIEKFKEEKRDRFVSHEEFPRLAEAITAELNQSVVAAIWLYLLTGLRKEELLNLKWSDIDMTRKELKLTDTKNGKSHYLPLSVAAIDVLNQVQRIEDNPYVIVGKNPGCHLVNIAKPWERIRMAAGLEDVRLHDLRRTVGSWLAQSNNSLHLIGKVLNHSNQSTTAIYARFGQDSVRDALEQHGQLITGMVSR
jgi:integrase